MDKINLKSLLRIAVTALVCYLLYLVAALVVGGQVLVVISIILLIVFICFVLNELGLF